MLCVACVQMLQPGGGAAECVITAHVSLQHKLCRTVVVEHRHSNHSELRLHVCHVNSIILR